MVEKVFTYKETKNDGKHFCDYEINTTSLVYIRCLKLYDKYLKTRNSGVKHFIIAKDVADVGVFGDVVTRLEYFDEGKLKTNLIFVAFMNKLSTFSDKMLLFPRFEFLFQQSIQLCFDSFLKINNILHPENFSSAASHSRDHQSETASELLKIFNCKISDCKFVLFKSKGSFDSFTETDEQLHITNDILGTDESAGWLRINEDIRMQCDSNDDHFKKSFWENLRIKDLSCENNDEIIIKDMRSLFQSSYSSFQGLCNYFKTEIKCHFSTSSCEALSEKSDFIQEFKKDFGLKLLPKETIDPSCSTGYPSASHAAEETELHKAAEQNHVEKMGELIFRDQSLLNSRDRDGKTPLHIACEMDSKEAVNFLLKDPVCLLDIADVNGKLVLHYAAENGNVDIMNNLLKCDQEIPQLINKKDINDETPLYIACKYGRTEAVELLLNVSRCSVDVDGEKLPLHCAARNGYVEIMDLLLKRDRNLLNNQDKIGETSLHLTCAVGNLEVVDFLLKFNDLEVNVKDKWGNTCFHTAALSNDCDILLALLHRETDLLNKTNNKGRTALHVAASIRNDAVIEFLLDKVLDMNVQDINGDTPLHLYVEAYTHTYFDIDNTDITIFKQEFSSLVNIANKDGDTPLHKAVLVADHESVKKLIEMGAEVNVKNNNGHTPEVLAQKLVDSFEKELIESCLKDATVGTSTITYYNTHIASDNNID